MRRRGSTTDGSRRAIAWSRCVAIGSNDTASGSTSSGGSASPGRCRSAGGRDRGLPRGGGHEGATDPVHPARGCGRSSSSRWRSPSIDWVSRSGCGRGGDRARRASDHRGSLPSADLVLRHTDRSWPNLQTQRRSSPRGARTRARPASTSSPRSARHHFGSPRTGGDHIWCSRHLARRSAGLTPPAPTGSLGGGGRLSPTHWRCRGRRVSTPGLLAFAGHAHPSAGGEGHGRWCPSRPMQPCRSAT